MNSMLQCLSHTDPLIDLFASSEKRYKSQLNAASFTKGKIAKEYGKVMAQLWGNEFTKVVPTKLKYKLGRSFAQFAGYSQQDSHDLLLNLMDKVHDDINRVAKKPYVIDIESKGRPDEIVAREAWRRVLLREDSEIYDSMFGLYRSEVICQGCKYISKKFAQYNCLSVPIPNKDEVQIRMFAVLLPFSSASITVSDPIYVEVKTAATSTIETAKCLAIEKLIIHGHITLPDVNFALGEEDASSLPVAARDVERDGFVVVNEEDGALTPPLPPTAFGISDASNSSSKHDESANSASGAADSEGFESDSSDESQGTSTLKRGKAKGGVHIPPPPYSPSSPPSLYSEVDYKIGRYADSALPLSPSLSSRALLRAMAIARRSAMKMGPPSAESTSTENSKKSLAASSAESIMSGGGGSGPSKASKAASACADVEECVVMRGDSDEERVPKYVLQAMCKAAAPFFQLAYKREDNYTIGIPDSNVAYCDDYSVKRTDMERTTAGIYMYQLAHPCPPVPPPVTTSNESVRWCNQPPLTFMHQVRIFFSIMFRKIKIIILLSFPPSIIRFWHITRRKS